jgi:hypothetical protein
LEINTKSRPQRRYDKGERRQKHVGQGAEAVIEFRNGNPKMRIGKCPSTFTEADRERLLQEAIPGPNGDRDLQVPKRLYVVHEGVIYEAQTSDHGYSYHGYPFHGRLSRRMIADLRSMADDKKCRDEFEAWVKKHIELQGRGQ